MKVRLYEANRQFGIMDAKSKRGLEHSGLVNTVADVIGDKHTKNKIKKKIEEYSGNDKAVETFLTNTVHGNEKVAKTVFSFLDKQDETFWKNFKTVANAIVSSKKLDIVEDAEDNLGMEDYRISGTKLLGFIAKNPNYTYDKEDLVNLIKAAINKTAEDNPEVNSQQDTNNAKNDNTKVEIATNKLLNNINNADTIQDKANIIKEFATAKHNALHNSYGVHPDQRNAILVNLLSSKG